MIIAVLTYFAVGAIAGTIAGLFGVGGGLIIVPFLALSFAQQGMHEAYIMHLAIGTSLGTIIFTSLSSVRAHYKLENIHLKTVFRLTPGIILGAAIGALIVDATPNELLKKIFSIFVLLVATQMAIGRPPKPSRELPTSGPLALAGAVIGTVSAIVGIGGGSLTVPYLVWHNVPMRLSVGTSAACGLPIAVAGAVSFIATGLDQTDLPAGAFGYIYLPALLGIAIATVVFAPIGAKLANRLDNALLKKLFAGLLLVIGLSMLLH